MPSAKYWQEQTQGIAAPALLPKDVFTWSGRGSGRLMRQVAGDPTSSHPKHGMGLREELPRGGAAAVALGVDLGCSPASSQPSTEPLGPHIEGSEAVGTGGIEGDLGWGSKKGCGWLLGKWRFSSRLERRGQEGRKGQEDWGSRNGMLWGAAGLM